MNAQEYVTGVEKYVLEMENMQLNSMARQKEIDQIHFRSTLLLFAIIANAILSAVALMIIAGVL